MFFKCFMFIIGILMYFISWVNGLCCFYDVDVIIVSVLIMRMFVMDEMIVVMV